MGNKIVIKIENLSKQYRLGLVGTGTLSHDLKRWWIKNILGKEDPFLKISEINERSTKGGSNYVWALKDINLDIHQGDVIGIIGKNGAGKSTLLKILSRVTKPTTGSIKYNGKIASLLEVGTGFHPEMTGRENIFMNGSIMGMTKAEIRQKLDDIVNFAGIERYVDTPVKRYSSGMTVRLGFSIAAHLEPDILVVDEVLAVGDAEFQKKAIGKMQDVSKGGGRTVLFVSHNMSAVKRLCNKGILLENGMISYHGNVEETISKYLISSSNRTISLKDRKDRKGNGNILVNEIVFSNSIGNSVSEIFSGDYLKIKFHFEKKDFVDISKLIIACSFSDDYENQVCTWVSDEMDTEFSKNNSNTVCLEIPSLILRPNVYNFSFQFSLGTTNAADFCDAIINAANLTILDSDYFKKGKAVRHGFSTLIKAEFIN